ncbi:MAG: hypothetical protein ACPG8W_22345 [Candidatus Promineifilaceae bacterium]
MAPSNVLYIICDELSRQYLGCYDHPLVKTPNLDRVHNLGTDSKYAEIVATFEAQLRQLLDPELINTRAFANQRAKIQELGGEEVLQNMPSFGFTPLHND